MNTRRFLTHCSIVVLLAACASKPASSTSSSSTGGSSGGSASDTVRTGFPSTMNALICNNLAGPCAAAGYTFSLSNCQAAVQSVFSDPGAGVTFDDANAKSCESTTSSQVAAGNLSNDCFAVYSGTFAPGASCTSDWQCAFTSETDSTGCDTTDGGFCVDSRVVESTAPCNQVPTRTLPYSDNCDTTFFCNSSTAGTCVALAESSGNCTIAECDANLYCGPGNVCTGAFGQGHPCDPTVAGECLTTDYCDPGSNTCVVRLATGASCDPTASDPGCSTQCSSLTSRCIDFTTIIGGYFCENQND